MSAADDSADFLPGAAVSQAARLTRRLAALYAAEAAVVALLLALGAWPIAGPQRLKDMAHEALVGGLGGIALAATGLALMVLVATALLTESRLWRRREEAAQAAGELSGNPPSLLAPLWRFGPGRLARQGQAIALTLGAALVLFGVWLGWRAAGAGPAAPGTANLIAAIVIGLAFPSLIAERMTAAFAVTSLPEAPALRRILALTTVGMVLAGAAEIGRGVGLPWMDWVERGLGIIAAVVALELALRGLAGLFLPPPSPETATAAVSSIAASALTGAARSPGALIRTHLGLDFARSWALQYLAAAAVPALVGTLMFCWLLSGVKLLGADQRGVYERLGAPVAVVGPGLHVLLPWPLGRLRPVENGTIHTIAVGTDQTTAEVQPIGAEATPTAAMNHLWDTTQPTEAEYLVASQSEGQQGFQAVDAEILVLYRTALTDQAAMQSVYGSTDQAAVVKREASRLATRYFSSHTLDDVMGGQRQSLEESLRAQLAQAVAADNAGVDVVAVLIEAVHPPAGAAAAYHAVQAAEINADAQVANASGHAARTLGEAQEEAQQALDGAQATAVEKQQGASGDAAQFGADLKGYHAAGPAFLLERRDADLAKAMKSARTTIVDSRLTAAEMPLIDLRPTGAPATPQAPAIASAAPSHSAVEAYVSDQPTPSTSTERPAPPTTSEDAAEPLAGGH